MVNPNRWSWGGPRKVEAREGALTSQQQPLDEPRKVDKPKGEKLQPGAASFSSRRLSKNRWSWRPDATTPVTRQDQENEREMQGRNQNQSGKADTPAMDSHRLSKHMETAEEVPAAAFASASYGAAPSYSTSKPRIQRSQQQEDEEPPSTGVKNVFSRVLSRRLSSYNMNKKSTPVALAEPTPPPSRHQQQQQQQQQQHPPMSMPPMPMQPSIRHGPQLHNPQNTLRAMSTPVGNVQNQGHIDNGHVVVAPLPELKEEENSQLQVPSTTRRPSTTPGAEDVALTNNASSSTSAAPPAIEETGLFGRLMRRRPVPKQRDAENHKKRGNSASTGDSTNQPSGVDDGIKSSTDPVPRVDETSEHRQTQSHSPPLNPSSHKTHKSPSSTPKSGTARTTSKSSVPRFLRQMTKPRQASSEAMTQTASPQQPAPSLTTQPKLQSKRSFGKRFWSRPSANDFGGDGTNHVAKTESQPVPPAHRTVYVPKHAAVDFSRTINPRLNRQSLVVGDDDQAKVVRAHATTTADARVGEPETQQKQRPLAVAAIDKHTGRDPAMAKYEAPSPTELHRRLEIIKRSETEVVATTEPASLNPWQHQLNLLQANSNTSASNTKAPVPKGHSRSISSRRHSFSLISDPHARELTPPRSVSPVETEAPTDPPTISQMPQQMVSAAPARPTSFYDCTQQNRQEGAVKQAAAREMTDFERFLAEAEAREREHQAQMWRNLARRSGHYGYSDNPWNAARPVDPSLAGTGAVNATTNRNNNNKRNSAPYPINRRESMMSEFYGPPTGTNGHSGDDADGTRGLGRQGSVSKRISHYIKPPKPSAQPTYEDWPTGRANRRSVIVGAIGE
ncbi:hypothetical protein LX32DRAFT_672176 [Colletotrichum zoysiae]|uniref:Uncharacterized protein n=1 Tax=Colletotrichum zoysiae TaxID=1216348 RepID=A0AAD9HKM7_9PEZI|nr:hypothetical protein LX32DRAFT_672176 [Colletotrichum zoysiae]